jgi:hypothetical protein
VRLASRTRILTDRSIDAFSGDGGERSDAVACASRSNRAETQIELVPSIEVFTAWRDQVDGDRLRTAAGKKVCRDRPVHRDRQPGVARKRDAHLRTPANSSRPV